MVGEGLIGKVVKKEGWGEGKRGVAGVEKERKERMLSYCNVL